MDSESGSVYESTDLIESGSNLDSESGSGYKSTDLIECGPHPDLDPKHWKKLLPMGRQNVLDPCAALTYLLLVESYRYQVRNVGG